MRSDKDDKWIPVLLSYCYDKNAILSAIRLLVKATGVHIILLLLYTFIVGIEVSATIKKFKILAQKLLKYLKSRRFRKRLKE